MMNAAIIQGAGLIALVGLSAVMLIQNNHILRALCSVW